MANRNFNRRQALEKEIKDIYLKVAIGSSGAPTVANGNGIGIASIVRNSAGNYSITLEDAYVSLKSFSAIHLASSAQDLTYQIISETVATTKIINFVCLTAGTPTDIASGSTLLVNIELKNTSAF